LETELIKLLRETVDWLANILESGWGLAALLVVYLVYLLRLKSKLHAEIDRLHVKIEQQYNDRLNDYRAWQPVVRRVTEVTEATTSAAQQLATVVEKQTGK
jgi:hypothetical protein